MVWIQQSNVMSVGRFMPNPACQRSNLNPPQSGVHSAKTTEAKVGLVWRIFGDDHLGYDKEGVAQSASRLGKRRGEIINT